MTNDDIKQAWLLQYVIITSLRNAAHMASILCSCISSSKTYNVPLDGIIITELFISCNQQSDFNLASVKRAKDNSTLPDHIQEIKE